MCLRDAKRLTVGNTADQLAIATDTEIHVILSLLSWSIWAGKCTLLFPKGGGHKGIQRQSARLCPKITHLQHSLLSWALFKSL